MSAIGSFTEADFKDKGYPLKETRYENNLEFENWALKRILIENGYIENNKYYFYIKDYLGNNRVVADQSGVVVQRMSYYPFGMSVSTPGQPYKFAGKELDAMHGLNLYDFHARQQMPDLGIFTSMDPLAEKYYSWSPYAYCANNPVRYVDLHGDSITTVINTIVTNPDGTTSVQSSTYYYGQDANGNYGFIGSNGQIYSGNNTYVNSLTATINNLRTGGPIGNALISGLVSSTNTVQIVQGQNTADSGGTFIRWNPNSITGGMTEIGTENRPAYIGLGHEMAHIQDTWNGTIDNSTWVTVGNTSISNAEKYATHVENQLRAENRIPLRTHYGIDASSGTRVGLESTRITRGGTSLFYTQPNGSSRGITLLSTPFVYRRR